MVECSAICGSLNSQSLAGDGPDAAGVDKAVALGEQRVAPDPRRLGQDAAPAQLALQVAAVGVGHPVGAAELHEKAVAPSGNS